MPLTEARSLRWFHTAIPQFYAHAMQAFGFLETRYGMKLHAMVAEELEYEPDANVDIAFVGTKTEAHIWWYFASAQMDVSFSEIRPPHASGDDASVVFSATTQPMAIRLETLAHQRGLFNDSDFLLRYKQPVSDADVKPRTLIADEHATMIHDDMAGILYGLARATVHYADALLRGDTSQFMSL